MSLPVCILAGGLATRLGALSLTTPKILIDIEGAPFAERQLAWLRTQGVADVVYCVGHLEAQVRAALGDGSRWGMRFVFVADGPELRGTGGAIRHALPYLAEPFLVLYGDSYLQCSLPDVERAFFGAGHPALMTVFRNDGRWDASNVEFTDGQIVRYDKVNRDERMRYVDYGLGVLSRQLFAGYREDAKFDLADLYRDLARENRLAGYEVRERFFEIGSEEGLRETRALFRARAEAASSQADHR